MHAVQVPPHPCKFMQQAQVGAGRVADAASVPTAAGGEVVAAIKQCCVTPALFLQVCSGRGKRLTGSGSKSLSGGRALGAASSPVSAWCETRRPWQTNTPLGQKGRQLSPLETILWSLSLSAARYVATEDSKEAEQLLYIGQPHHVVIGTRSNRQCCPGWPRFAAVVGAKLELFNPSA